MRKFTGETHCPFETRCVTPLRQVYEKPGNMCVADPSGRKRSATIGVRPLIKASQFSQTTVYRVLKGEPIRCHILASFRQAVEKSVG